MNRAQRFVTYGLAGWAFEILFTGAKGPFRDKNWRLSSHTYLWMMPIYGSAAFLLEPAHDRLRGRPWWQRGAVYTVGFYGVEAVSGALLRRTTGETPWDYTRARGTRPVPRNWRGLVRPAYAPVWFAVGMGAERLHDALTERD